ncbi:MAG: hypothetical protein FD149_2778 [Rhodospirillaceae bacterium]|nr:MAG: hypothetical protein FD149_2778 [Rhodospirillaceae bacterium]
MPTTLSGGEYEVFQYQLNIDHYTTRLASLPGGDWPAELAQYKTTPSDQLPDTLTDAQVQTISDFQYRDRLRILLRTEKIEQGKARRILAALKVHIPANQYDTAIADAVARREAAVQAAGGGTIIRG